MPNNSRTNSEVASELKNISEERKSRILKERLRVQNQENLNTFVKVALLMIICWIFTYKIAIPKIRQRKLDKIA